jgi:hypothetical protein
MRPVRRRLSLRLAAAVILTAALSPSVYAVDVGVPGKSLVINVSTVLGKSKLTSVQRGAGIAVGAAGNPAALSGSLQVYYVDDTANGNVLAIPSPWLTNTGVVARFKNSFAPAGPTVVRASTVRSGRIARVVSKGLGGMSIATPPGSGGVITIFTLANGNDSSTHRFCSRYSLADGSTVFHKITASGFKLKLKNGVAITCPTCSDAQLNGTETGVDCGGLACAACADGGGCRVDADCQSGVCSGNVCQVPSCSDGVHNGDETDVDCGGSCGGCVNGDGCAIDADCLSGACIGTVCVVPPCANGIIDGGETDVDCGGGTCPDCPDGELCNVGGDCTSGVCLSNICQAPSCFDAVQNGAETDTDCGGGTCPDCPDGGDCVSGSDCTSGVCTLNICQAPNCSDGVQNGTELGVDCGAPCAPCSCTSRGQCLMFVTSTSSGGNLGGLASADAICAARASSAGLVGTYQAWLCDGVTAPAGRSLHASVPYRRTDGVLIANNWSDLTDGSIANAINRTESGADVSGSAPFLPWTYVTTSGTCDNETYLSPGSGPCPAFSNCKTNCANNGGNNGWTSSNGFVQGSKGDINATNGNWTDGATGLCSTPAERIYCIEQ